jgi:sugar phosphate isomerase/epimerase
MDFEHPAHPGRRVRLAYCLNVLASEDERALVAQLDAVCVPVREHVVRATGGGTLGVGLYLPANLAFTLAEDRAADRRRALVQAFEERGLAVFSANAFPFGGFHRPGLKQRVFRPAWDERERVLFTAAVAVVATEFAARDAAAPGGHFSISTHTGLHRDEPRALERVEAVGAGLAFALVLLERIAAARGVDVVLALEPEPRSLAGDTHELAALWPRLVAAIEAELERRGVRAPAELVRRHLGLCLDTCHAAVEFEDGGSAARCAHALGIAVGKVQVSSALRLERPGSDAVGRERLLALDEPVYLHQVTARTRDEFLRCGDLSELARRLSSGERAAWLAADEWRCHFHVPVDAPEPLPGAGGLATTAREGAATLGVLLDDPSLWGTRDLHVEVETYTFDVLPAELRAGGLAAGLARELEWTRARLEEHGWRVASSASGSAAGSGA